MSGNADKRSDLNHVNHTRPQGVMSNGTSNGPVPAAENMAMTNVSAPSGPEGSSKWNPGVTASRRGTHFEPVPQATETSPISAKLAEMEAAIKLSNKKFTPGGVPWIKTSRADTIFGSVIMLNSVFLGIDVSVMDRDPAGDWLFWFIESCFLVIFIYELYLRVRVELPHWRKFFDGWGIFDSTITVLGCLDAWLFTLVFQGDGDENPLNSFAVLRVLRVLRLARLIRVFRMFGELVVMIETLFRSLKAIGWIALILTLVMYIGSIICVMLLGQDFSDTDEDVDLYFGNMAKALYSHFAVVTTENWPTYTDTAANHGWLWGIYFVLFVIFTNFVLVNLMVGIITENVCAAEKEQDEATSSFAAESLQFRQTLQTLFDASDVDASGDISYQEVRELLAAPQTVEIMAAFGVNIGIPAKTLHTIMHLNQEGVTSFDEFYNSCIRLCGSKDHIHSLFVQEDVNRIHQDLLGRFTSLVQRVQKAASGRRGLQPPGCKEPRPEAPGAGHPWDDENAEAAVEELNHRMERCEVAQQQVLLHISKLRDEAVQRRNRLRQASAMKEGGVSTPVAILSGPFSTEQNVVTGTQPQESPTHPESRALQAKSQHGAAPSTFTKQLPQNIHTQQLPQNIGLQNASLVPFGTPVSFGLPDENLGPTERLAGLGRS